MTPAPGVLEEAPGVIEMVLRVSGGLQGPGSPWKVYLEVQKVLDLSSFCLVGILPEHLAPPTW